MRSYSSQTAVMAASSLYVKTLPVGLCGVLSKMALVLIVTAASNSSME
jgi:hypothetical protein